MDKGKFVELFPKMVVIYLGLATAVTMKTIDLTKNQEIQLLSQLLIERVVFCYLFKITKKYDISLRKKLVVAPEEGLFKNLLYFGRSNRE